MIWQCESMLCPYKRGLLPYRDDACEKCKEEVAMFCLIFEDEHKQRTAIPISAIQSLELWADADADGQWVVRLRHNIPDRPPLGFMYSDYDSALAQYNKLLSAINEA